MTGPRSLPGKGKEFQTDGHEKPVGRMCLAGIVARQADGDWWTVDVVKRERHSQTSIIVCQLLPSFSVLTSVMP